MTVQNPAGLSHGQLVSLVRELQELLFADEPDSERGGARCWVYDNGLDGLRGLDQVRELLDDNGLAPL